MSTMDYSRVANTTGRSSAFMKYRLNKYTASSSGTTHKIREHLNFKDEMKWKRFSNRRLELIDKFKLKLKQYSIGYTDGSFHFIFSTNDSPHKCLKPNVANALASRTRGPHDIAIIDQVLEILDNDMELYVVYLIITNPKVKASKLYRSLSTILSHYTHLDSTMDAIVATNQIQLKRDVFDVFLEALDFRTKYEKLLSKADKLSQFTTFKFVSVSLWEENWYNRLKFAIATEIRKNRFFQNLDQSKKSKNNTSKRSEDITLDKSKGFLILYDLCKT